MPNLGLDVRPIILVHFSEAFLLFLSVSELILSVNNLNFSFFVNKIEDVNVLSLIMLLSHFPQCSLLPKQIVLINLI